MLVFDVRGRQVAAVEGPSGTGLVWDGKDSAGKPVGSGVYLYRLKVGPVSEQGTVVVVK
jgi:hypothetical protein